MVDIESIGAGGGSIARVDEFGSLSVGPTSAGANPGPACYGRGGDFATVTDANLVLGRINPSNFLGGELQLDVQAARRAIDENVSGAYGMTTEQAALGIVTVINSNMTRLLWEVMIGRGYDPRDFSLLAFGGAGPLHACELASSLGIGEVIIPKEPGTFSAFGILTADARHDYERMLAGSASEVTDAELEQAFVELEQAGRSEISSEHAGYSQVDVMRALEMRYFGQDHPLVVDLPAGLDGDSLLASCQELFHQKHERLYGFRRMDTAVELVRIQVSAIGRIPRSDDAWIESERLTASSPITRKVYVTDLVDAAVHRRGTLREGFIASGPCIVEEAGSTTYVPPDCTVQVEDGCLRVGVPVPEKTSSTDERHG
jgi:N-methylhydantoinase A